MLHIDIPTLPEFKALAATRSDACVSLYVPTSPLAEDTQANRIVFEDLAKEALSQLRAAGLDKRRIAPIAEQFGHLSGIIQENTDDNKFRFPQRDQVSPKGSGFPKGIRRRRLTSSGRAGQIVSLCSRRRR